MEPHVARAHPAPEHRARAAGLLGGLLALDPGRRLAAWGLTQNYKRTMITH